MGQVGKRATEILLRRGHTVVALDLGSVENRAVATGLTSAPGQPGVLVPAYVDLVDADAVRALVAEHRPQVIVHLAAVVSPPCYRAPEQARRVNVGGTANLVAAARELPSPPAFVLASSSARYRSLQPHPPARRHPPP